MSAPSIIAELVVHFARNVDAYRTGLNETELRVQFVDPFFEALGWDIHNKLHYSETYKDVVHEYRSGVHAEAPDYCFQVGGTRMFFVEAKRPAVNIATDSAPAFQVRSYAWTSKLPLSLLTNFAQLAVYDCRKAPRPSDSPAVGRIDLIPFTQYVDRWEEIASRFSKESVYQGSFDRYIETSKLKKGTAEVDDAFLAEIQQWRKSLASNIAEKNIALSQREVNFAVQQTINRIVFLRICEDRGIERYGQLQEVAQTDNVYKRLVTIYERADERYNSGLFHFTNEPNRAEYPDTLTPRLRIDDACLKPILRRFYYPDSPYKFSHLPAEILGQVYEQFLGQVITLTPAHKARIKPKPELKKAAGVYYTPAYIVDFIVRQTVGALLKGRSPKDVNRVRVLDPACGSGSFLLGAYQYLLNWHRDSYLSDGSEKNRKLLYRNTGGEWQLTTTEKKRILLNNIFGVDIDSQAVEVTKLSLLLKVMEGESDQTLGTNLRIFHERALPDLGNNIKCGNSLVDSDFYQYAHLLTLDEEERLIINPFDWNSAQGFAQVMRNGGFDAVIGNPPYSYRKSTQDKLRPYYLARFKSAGGNFELYKFFMERNVQLCRKGSVVGMIISATFLVQPTFTKLRRLLLETQLTLLAPLGPKVFKKATVDTAIIVIKKNESVEGHSLQVLTPSSPLDLPRTVAYPVRQHRFTQNPGYVFDYKLAEQAAATVQRLIGSFPSVEHGYEFGVGINTGYIRDQLVANNKVDSRYHAMVPGSGISRYGSVETDGWIMYDPNFVNQQGDLGRTLPAERLLSSEKILVVRTRNLSLKRRIIATIDASGAYNLNRLSNIVARPGFSLYGLLGILNSQLFQWLFATRFFDYEIKPVYLRSAPLANSNDPALVSLVTEMIRLNHRLNEAHTAQEHAALRRQIEFMDSSIDCAVYRLYGILDQEIEFIESAR